MLNLVNDDDEVVDGDHTIKTFSLKDARKPGKQPSNNRGDEKIPLVMHCNREMRQYLVEVKSQPEYVRVYYGNLRKNITYFKKLTSHLKSTNLTKRLDIQEGSPEVPKPFSGNGIKSFGIDKDWYEDISTISDYINTSMSNMGLILSYVSLPIEFYLHFPKMINLYENLEYILNRYYIIGDIKLKKLQMIKDCHHNIYDHSSDILKLLQGIIEIYDNINDDSKNEGFKKDVDTIISLLNKEFPTSDQIDYMEYFVNRYWELLVNNGYTKNLKYW